MTASTATFWWHVGPPEAFCLSNRPHAPVLSLHWRQRQLLYRLLLRSLLRLYHDDSHGIRNLQCRTKLSFFNFLRTTTTNDGKREPRFLLALSGAGRVRANGTLPRMRRCRLQKSLQKRCDHRGVSPGNSSPLASNQNARNQPGFQKEKL